MTLAAAHKLFHDTFGVSLNPFLDGTLMVMMRKPIISISKFDDWLHKKFGDYEDNGLSMSDVLVNNYEVANGRI